MSNKKPRYHSWEQNFNPFYLKPYHNVCLDDLQIMFEYELCDVKKYVTRKKSKENPVNSSSLNCLNIFQNVCFDNF